MRNVLYLFARLAVAPFFLLLFVAVLLLWVVLGREQTVRLEETPDA